MLLEAQNLSRSFASRDGKSLVHAVNGVDLRVAAGTTMGIVGESGCGKSTLARLLLRLIEPSGGSIRFDGRDVLAMNGHELKALRRHMQFVHQDPFASLNPRMSVQAIISEPLDIHAIGTSTSRRQRVDELLSLVGMDRSAATKYPHEFSGGQRQRICIARAIAIEPKLVVLDEPVSALDVSIQAQILNLLNDLKARLGLTYVLISHDLSVVKYLCDQVAVMYLGKFVEQGPADAVLNKPLHPYTQALVSAVPDIATHTPRQRIILNGEPPNPEQLPSGCAFHPRCFKAVESCRTTTQQLRDVGTEKIACDQVPVQRTGRSNGVARRDSASSPAGRNSIESFLRR